MQPVSRGKNKSSSKSSANYISKSYHQKTRQTCKNQFSHRADPLIRLCEILPATMAPTRSLYTAVLPQTSLQSLYAPLALYMHQTVWKTALVCAAASVSQRLLTSNSAYGLWKITWKKIYRTCQRSAIRFFRQRAAALRCICASL